jgi:Putative DNA-binding domain
MHMIEKPIEKIGLSDLTALIGHVRESKTIEFKRAMPGGKDSDVEFLAGVSALANTAGGDFVIGITTTKDGVADSVVGVRPPNLDAEKLRLEQLLASCVEPRLPRVDIHPVACSDGAHVLVVRAAHSWVGPHRVTKNNKFYARNSAGKYALDVGELRTAFSLSGAAAERVRAFRTDRLAKIAARETPVPLTDATSIVLHMVPLPSFADRQAFDMVAALAAGTHFPLPLTGMTGSNRSRVNLDGIVNYYAQTQDGAKSYVQVFRNGAIEGVAVMNREADGAYIVDTVFANMIVAATRQYLAVMKSLDVAFPIFALLSFCNAAGCRMRYTTDMSGMWYNTEPLHENVVAFPEITFDDSAADIPALLRPLLNIVSNAFGLGRSGMYDGQGGWMGTA